MICHLLHIELNIVKVALEGKYEVKIWCFFLFVFWK